MNSIRIYFIICSCLISECVSSQEDSIKYQHVINYLDTNKSAGRIIRGVFKSFIKKDQPIDFQVSPWVKLMLINWFKDLIHAADYFLTENQVRDHKQYLKDFEFETYFSDFLQSKKIDSTSRLFLSFSKPVNNYLIVEMCSRDPGKDWCSYAKYIQFLFRFDEAGMIESFITNQGAAN